MGNKKFTFKQLLTNKKVEIPVLQRDYVQGNLKDRKAENIREDFVSDLVTHLVQPQPDEMTLDFIYGKIIDDNLNEEQERREEHLESLLDTVSEYAEKNGYEIQKGFKRLSESVSKDTFIPFDGQQRLTTLFLLHFLVYSKTDKDISFLRQFLYKTRESSRDFLEALLNNASDFNSDEVWESSFINFIEDRNWFYDFWKYDPTVMSMMVMLEEFRKKLVQQEDLQNSVNEIYSNLERDNILTFDFLDIDEHQLDDILYVKMNASGKELSEFEKFKSWLIEYVEDKKNNFVIEEKDWAIKLDTIWYDLFWEVDAKETDGLLYQFFKKLLLFKYCSNEIEASSEDGKQNMQKTRKLVYDRLNGKDVIPFRFYDDHKVIDSESLNFIWVTLTVLSDDTVYMPFEASIRKVWNATFLTGWQQDESFKHFLIKNLENLNLFHQTFLFSIFTYIKHLNKISKEFSEENFFDWIRLSRNLIYNSRIDDTTPFFNAIQSIKKFGHRCLDLKEAVAHEKFIDYFPERQRKEEFEKNNELYNPWKDDFIAAENHSYFYGQIGFLITLSRVGSAPDHERFQYLYAQLSEIFNEGNLNVNSLISRSLLTINHNWLPDYGSSRRLFCLSNRGNSRDRDENWRRVFNDYHKSNILTELADLYHQFGSLKSIIAERKGSINDWRRLFLEYPDELSYCKQGLINYSKNGDYIRLLGESRISHYHKELRTSILFNHFLKQKFGLSPDKYEKMKSDDDCYISLNADGFQIRIIFDFNTLEFNFYESADDSNIKILDDKNINEELYQLVKNMECYTS